MGNMAPRNSTFTPEREPFSHIDALELQHQHISGPFSFLNPTNAHFRHTGPVSKGGADEDFIETSPSEDGGHPSPVNTLAGEVGFLWRSRDNRKGRHALQIQEAGPSAPYVTPARTSSMKEIGRSILRMFTYFPVWDISYDIALIFTLGSVVWVINSFFAFLPYTDPSTDFSGEVLDGGGITAFIGAIIFFETGSILLFFEAINENRDGCFGWALENIFQGDKPKHSQISVKPDFHHCAHHHQNRHNFVGKCSGKTLPDAKGKDEQSKDAKSWQWCPSWHALRTHYFHELGFIAGAAQLTGATIFGISGFTALPGVNNHLEPQKVLNGVYWVPQIVGGSFFILSGSLYMLETQKAWYKPAFGVLGWHIGFWNTIGGIGFTLCGALGPSSATSSGCAYQSSLATFWGSWAFLIGSAMQWYESLDKHPVEKLQSEQADSKSTQQ